MEDLMRYWLPLLLFGFAIQTQALLKPQVGLGYSDNVNYESTQKDADFYWWGRALGLRSFENWDATLWLNVKDYRTQNTNDQAHGRIGLTYLLDTDSAAEMTADLSVGSLQYLRGTPNSTDTAFNNSYWIMSLASEWSPENSVLSEKPMEWQLAFQNTRYEGNGLRTDRELRAGITAFGLLTELGHSVSSDNYYSKSFLELNYDWESKAPNDWRPNLGISVRYSYYPNRKFSQTVQSLNNRNGQLQTSVQEENESQLLLQFQPAVSKIYGVTRIRLGLNLTLQKSRSQNADYLETSVVSSVERTF
jgi:hypothetical protein